jgi:predicted membrane channel-forming protein YqfA (hemolysin III family)
MAMRDSKPINFSIFPTITIATLFGLYMMMDTTALNQPWRMMTYIGMGLIATVSAVQFIQQLLIIAFSLWVFIHVLLVNLQ